jgi:dipeptidyl aminopeptidase/acylaminoacyl peptidase
MVAHPRTALLAVDVVSPLGVAGVWTYDVAEDRFSPWAVPDVAADVPAPIPVRYPTFDSVDGGARRTIPALIFPAAPGFDGRRPVLIDIHGGPAMQTRVVAPPHYELVRRIGVTIVAPNVRGSSGYGKSYAALDDRERREDAVRDVGALLDWIATQPDLDATRVAVTGGSYGGYMALATLVHYSDRLRCGMELFGISDFVTFLQASEDGHYPEAQRAEYGDERDPATRAFLESISPVRHAERIRVPLLIFQGANDVRVKAQESRQMVERIRAAGGTVTYVEAADEGHSIEQPLNQLYLGSLVSEFTARCLVR